jgi:WD40 repeat protein
MKPATFALVVLFCSTACAAPFVAPRDPQCVAYAPDGERVALGFSGQSNGEFPPRPHPNVRKCGIVQMHDATTAKRLWRLETFGDLTDLRFSPNGRLVAFARVFMNEEGLELDEVRVLSAVDGRTLQVLDRCHAFTFSPDGERLLAVGRKRCAEFDLSTGRRLREIEELNLALTLEFVDETRLIAVTPSEEEASEYVLRIVDADSGKRLKQSWGADQPIYHIAVSPEGKLLATGRPGGKVLVWNIEELKPIAALELGTRGYAHPFFSPQGDLLGAGDQATGDVVFFGLADGRERSRYTFERGSFRTVYPRTESMRERPELDPARFAFSPSGEAFLTGAFGGVVRMVATGQDVQRFGE